MEKQPTASLIRHFEELPDPRTGIAKAHIFLEILIIESTAKTFLNTKDTKATKEIQGCFENVEPRRRLS